jgi:hypothetical protein
LISSSRNASSSFGRAQPFLGAEQKAITPLFHLGYFQAMALGGLSHRRSTVKQAMHDA